MVRGYGLTVISQRAVKKIGVFFCVRVLHIHDKLREHKGFGHILVLYIRVLEGEEQPVVLVPPVRYRSRRHIADQLVHVCQLGPRRDLPAAKGDVGDAQGHFQVHARGHSGPPVGGDFVFIHLLFHILASFFRVLPEGEPGWQ